MARHAKDEINEARHSRKVGQPRCVYTEIWVWSGPVLGSAPGWSTAGLDLFLYICGTAVDLYVVFLQHSSSAFDICICYISI